MGPGRPFLCGHGCGSDERSKSRIRIWRENLPWLRRILGRISSERTKGTCEFGFGRTWNAVDGATMHERTVASVEAAGSRRPVRGKRRRSRGTAAVRKDPRGPRGWPCRFSSRGGRGCARVQLDLAIRTDLPFLSRFPATSPRLLSSSSDAACTWSCPVRSRRSEDEPSPMRIFASIRSGVAPQFGGWRDVFRLRMSNSDTWTRSHAARGRPWPMGSVASRGKGSRKC